MFLRIGKNVRRVAIFLGLGWRGEVIILLLGCGRAGIKFLVGMEGVIFFGSMCLHQCCHTRPNDKLVQVSIKTHP